MSKIYVTLILQRCLMCIQAICHQNTHFAKITEGHMSQKVTKKKKTEHGGLVAFFLT